MRKASVDDYNEICNLLFRYAECLHSSDYEGVGELFRYGRLEIEGVPNFFEGPDQVATMFREATETPAERPHTLIYTTNVQVKVDGEEAAVRSYYQVLQARPQGLTPVVGGRYHDQLVRRDGAWVFAVRHMYVDLLGDMNQNVKKPIDGYITRT